MKKVALGLCFLVFAQAAAADDLCNYCGDYTVTATPGPVLSSYVVGSGYPGILDPANG